MNDISFYKCSIAETPFSDEQFDLVFSNHVIEHINDVDAAFDEFKRIGKSNCIYAFTVPTNIWLMLSIPGQYYNKLRKVINFIKCAGSKGKNSVDTKNHINSRNKAVNINNLLRAIFPIEHGAYSGFMDSWRSFKIKQWKEFLSGNGFLILKTEPLLLYGPSEWPIIPTTKIFNRLNICSSVLFLMKKDTKHDKKM